MKLIKSALAALGILALSVSFAAAGDAINKKCPVKGKDVAAGKSADYTIKFCCEKCVAKFNKDPLAYTKKIAEAKDGKCAFSGKDVSDDADASATVTIGVCCGGCVKKVKADPGKYYAKLKKAS